MGITPYTGSYSGPSILLCVEPGDIDEIREGLRAIENGDEFAAVAGALLAAVVDAVRAIRDPEQRMVAAHALMESWRQGTTDTSDERHFAACVLWDEQGWTFPDYYDSLHADKTMVQAILKGRAGLKRERRTQE
jgi:hypothetical protein